MNKIQCPINDVPHDITTARLEPVQKFFCKLGSKLYMYLVEIIIFSLYSRQELGTFLENKVGMYFKIKVFNNFVHKSWSSSLIFFKQKNLKDSPGFQH